MSIVVCLGVLTAAALFTRWHVSRHRCRKQDWSIGGVSVRMHKSQLSLEERGGCDTSAGWVFPHSSAVGQVRFDDKGLVKDVSGVVLEGPYGCFRSGQSFNVLQKKLGRPDRQDTLTVRYFLSGIGLDISLSAQNRRLITGFHLTALYGLDAVEAESIILAKYSS